MGGWYLLAPPGIPKPFEGSPNPSRVPQHEGTTLPHPPEFIRGWGWGGRMQHSIPKFPPNALVLGAATPILGLLVAEQSSQGCKPVAFPALHCGMEFFEGINNQFEANCGFLGSTWQGMEAMLFPQQIVT